MKLASFFHNGNEIEIHNNWLGKETIKYNGEDVSEHYSIMGAEHKFSVLEDEVWADYVIVIGFSNCGVGFNIYRNGEPLMEWLGRKNFSRNYRESSEFVWRS